jgi:vacuolar-type H+-ATPase subunit H
MDDHEVLQHLLELENEAAALVNDAQAEADRRVSDGEKQNRARFDEAYANIVKTLEASYVEELAAARDNYRKQLEAYRETLEAVPLDMPAFSSLAEKFLIAAQLCREPKNAGH